MTSSEGHSENPENERRDQGQDQPFNDHPIPEDPEEQQIPHEDFDEFDESLQFRRPEEYDRIVAAITRQLADEQKLVAPKKSWVERATSFSEWSNHLSRGGLRMLELVTAGVLLWFLTLFLFWPDRVSPTINQLEPFFESGGAYALAIILAALRVPKMIESFFNRNGSGSNGAKSDAT